MRITSIINIPTHTYHLNNTKIETVTHHKHLGAGLPPVPDLPGLSRFGARCPGDRRVPHRDIKVSRFVKI
jgi:hypothetical protein